MHEKRYREERGNVIVRISVRAPVPSFVYEFRNAERTRARFAIAPRANNARKR